MLFKTELTEVSTMEELDKIVKRILDHVESRVNMEKLMRKETP